MGGVVHFATERKKLIMLLEIAIGDAFGACYEWMDKWEFMDKIELKYKSIAPSLVKPGNYTDDTQMTLAIAEAMVEGDEWTPWNLAHRFGNCFHRDPRRGYAPGFQLFLETTHSAKDFLANIKPTSERSGAAMRAGPVGLFANIETLMERSDIQSNITHNTDKGRTSGLCSALMVHYFRYKLGQKKDLLSYLGRFFPINIGELQRYDHIPVEGWPCVMAATDAILRSDSLSELLINCVKFAGDTDTICAIAMGPASFCDEITKDIPQCLVDGLENGKYGRDYIVELDKQLLSKEF